MNAWHKQPRRPPQLRTVATNPGLEGRPKRTAIFKASRSLKSSGGVNFAIGWGITGATAPPAGCGPPTGGGEQRPGREETGIRAGDPESPLFLVAHSQKAGELRAQAVAGDVTAVTEIDDPVSDLSFMSSTGRLTAGCYSRTLTP